MNICEDELHHRRLDVPGGVPIGMAYAKPGLKTFPHKMLLSHLEYTKIVKKILIWSDEVFLFQEELVDA